MSQPDDDALPPDELEPETDAEGLDVEGESNDEEGNDWTGVAPPDRKLIAQPVDLAVSDLVAQITAKELHLNPVYQRRYVWDDRKASKLVESLLINVPIPVCYLAEESDGTRSTIDGQQRLRSLHRFLGNEFALRGLDILADINGRRFQQLSDRQQRLVRNRTIRCIVISEDSHPDIRFDVFERLNTGSVALTAQELRNSVYRGPFNDLLHELAEDADFRRCLGNRADKRMNFEELILRFFALEEDILKYRPSFKVFLNKYMRERRDLSSAEIDVKRDLFKSTIKRVHAAFGDNSFRRVYYVESGTAETSPAVNSALYDAIMVNFARVELLPAGIRGVAESIQDATRNLMLEDQGFIDAISLATGDRTRLRRRIGLFSERLEVLGIANGLADRIANADEADEGATT